MRGRVLVRLAGMVMLTACGTGGVAPVTSSVTPQTATAPDGAVPLSRAREPEGVGFYDLCVDDEAIDAGLDGGALAEDRGSMGITCPPDGGGIGLRYGFLAADGTLFLLGADERDSFVPPASSMRQPPGSRLGYDYLLSGRWDAPTSEDGRLEVKRSTVLVEGTVVRGLVVNHRASFARQVTVTATDPSTGVSAAVPVGFPMQPGESAPFELDLGATPTDPATLELTVGGNFSAAAPPQRSLLFSGGTGWQDGTPAGLAESAVPGALDGVPAGARVTYYETVVEAVLPTSHPGLHADLLQYGIGPPSVTGAFVDEIGRVTDVFELATFAEAGRRPADRPLDPRPPLGDEVVVGVVVPPDQELRLWGHGRVGP